MTTAAVIVVRDGVLPAGALEAVAEAGGRTVLAGTGTHEAASALHGLAHEVRAWETDRFAPGAWATALAPILADEDVVILPASPDGRDLAPRLAFALRRPILAGALRVRGDGAVLGRGLVSEDVAVVGPFVATLQPGVRRVVIDGGAAAPTVDKLDLRAAPDGRDADVVEVLAADAATIDLEEAPRIVAGGAGLSSAERFEQLARVGAAIGAATGATRVVTDRGWMGHERQIGTTGVVVSPRLYLAFGISGAVQHTSGLGDPAHVISVNVDAHCPMMQRADLAIVCDANAVLDELEAALHTVRSPAAPGAAS